MTPKDYLLAALYAALALPVLYLILFAALLHEAAGIGMP